MWPGGQIDRQTDMTKLKVAFFCSFANSPQKHTCLNSKKKPLRIYVLRNHALYSAGQIFFFTSAPKICREEFFEPEFIFVFYINYDLNDPVISFRS